jgi:hypothetical protein
VLCVIPFDGTTTRCASRITRSTDSQAPFTAATARAGRGRRIHNGHFLAGAQWFHVDNPFGG